MPQAAHAKPPSERKAFLAGRPAVCGAPRAQSGFAGLAQYWGFRGATADESDLSDRLEADLDLDGWSLQRDIQIALSTLRVLIHDRVLTTKID